jgi:hypothetical protein
MANYYVDGSVTSANGAGAGTQGDPWVKTNDLLQYAVDQILAGAGKGAQGDWISILDGNLTQTAPLDLSVYNPSNGVQLTINGHAGHQPTIDLGGAQMFDQKRDGIRLHNLRFINFTNVTSEVGVHLKYHGHISLCVFDGQNQDFEMVLRIEGSINVLGCQFINFAPPAPSSNHGALIFSGSSGNNWIKGCYFETGGGNDNYMIWSYSSVIEDCVFKYSGSGTMYYAVIPVRQLRLSNCTFYRAPSAGWMFAAFFSNYQNNSMVNCYFENLAEPIYNSQSSVNGNVSTMLAGNRAFNSANLYPSNPQYLPAPTLLYSNNDWDVSESLLIDPANGDFRPKSGLVGAGLNLQDYGFPAGNLTNQVTVGGVNGLKPDSIVGQYNPFGGA